MLSSPWEMEVTARFKRERLAAEAVAARRAALALAVAAAPKAVDPWPLRRGAPRPVPAVGPLRRVVGAGLIALGQRLTGQKGSGGAWSAVVR